jgi:hypothetical protein
MELNYTFNKALHTLQALTPADRHRLASICRDIRQSEDSLNRAATKDMDKCMTACTGICCRNIRLTEIIGFCDFVYMLTVAGGMTENITACLKHESLFSSDCIFLKNGKGPCMLPSNARPRICITSFCFDDTPVKQQIRDVNRRFSELSRFVFARRIKMMVPSWFHR